MQVKKWKFNLLKGIIIIREIKFTFKTYINKVNYQINFVYYYIMNIFVEKFNVFRKCLRDNK